jgi:hypothetical protein
VCAHQLALARSRSRCVPIEIVTKADAWALGAREDLGSFADVRQDASNLLRPQSHASDLRRSAGGEELTHPSVLLWVAVVPYALRVCAWMDGWHRPAERRHQRTSNTQRTMSTMRVVRKASAAVLALGVAMEGKLLGLQVDFK